MSLGFHNEGAPIAPIHPAAEVGAAGNRAIELSVNGQLKQKSTVDKLIWSVEEMIAYLSKYFTLQPGDLIMTGMPAGVSAVKKGDLMECKIEGLRKLNIKIG